jgi:tetratricopeptide (TPR) repeat protein
MPIMRIWLTVTTIVALYGSAVAEPGVVVVGPATSGNVAASDISTVKQAVAKAADAEVSDRAIDTACAADASCLAAAAAGARQIIALTLAPKFSSLAIGIVLVDVEGKEVITKRELTIKPNKIAKELGAEVKKLLAEAPIERAKALFADGNKHFNLGELEQALALYTRAYRIKPLPGFLFNIAQCHRKLGHFQDAITTYQSFLATHPDASNRAVVESLIKEAQEQLAAKQRADLDKAAEEGRREAERLAAEKARAEEDRKAKEAEAKAAGERRKAEEARIAAELEKTYNRHPARKWSIAFGAVGAGGLIAGGVFGLLTRTAQQSFRDAGCGDPETLVGETVFAKCLDDKDRGQRYAQLTNIFLIGGGVVLAASAVVFVIDPGNRERPDSPRAAVTVSPSSAQVVVRW